MVKQELVARLEARLQAAEAAQVGLRSFPHTVMNGSRTHTAFLSYGWTAKAQCTTWVIFSLQGRSAAEQEEQQRLLLALTAAMQKAGQEVENIKAGRMRQEELHR